MNLRIYENTLDYGTYYELRESVNWKNFCKVQVEQALENSVYTVVAKIADKAVAMGRIIGDGLYFTIVDVVVRPEFQGKGIGSKVLESLLIHIENTLPKDGRASVQLIAEKGKETFYEKYGFKQIPNEFCGSGMRKIIWQEYGVKQSKN